MSRPAINSGNDLFFCFCIQGLALISHVLDVPQKKVPKEKKEKREMKGDALESSNKRKIHHSSRGQKKAIPMEDLLDPLKASTELFCNATNEDVIAFKGTVPKSYWVNNNVISNWNSVLLTKQWGPLSWPIATSCGRTLHIKMAF